jgi:hypothetical protein
MIRTTLKTILGALIAWLAVGSALAQPVAKIGYFMDNATHKHLMNPALVPARGYISYPALGSIDFNIQSNLSLPLFLYPGVGANDPLVTFLHESVSAEQFLGQLDPNMFLRLNQRLSLVSFGAYFGQSFWTFEAATRIHTGVNIPKDFFAFLKQGMSSAQGNRYEINDLKVSAGALAELSLGSSFPVTDDIRVGVKGKLLVGGAKAEAGIDQMIIDMRPDKWTVSSQGLISLYGAGFDFTQDSEGVIDGFDFGAPNKAGMGFGLDVGASWKPLDFLEVSAGIIDIGRINWDNTYNRIARSMGTTTFTGMENLGSDTDSDEDPFQEITDGLLEMAQFKVVDESANLAESLIPTINMGVEAGVLSNKISLGLLYSNRLIPGNPMQEVTGILNLKPWTGFNIAGSYSLLNGVQDTYGLAMGINLLIANIFIACDYIPMRVATGIPIPLNKATTHVQLGMSISLGKMKR